MWRSSKILVVIVASITTIKCHNGRVNQAYTSALASASGPNQRLYGERSLVDEVAANPQGQAEASRPTMAGAAPSAPNSPAKASRQNGPYQYKNAAATGQYYDNNYAAQYATIDASGMANVNVQMDLRVLTEKLNIIPFIHQALVALVGKVDQLSGINPSGGIEGQIYQFDQIKVRLAEQDKKINVMMDCCSQSSANLQALAQQVSQTQKMFMSMQANGFVKVQQCDLSQMEGRLSQLTASLVDLFDMLRKINSQLDLPYLVNTILKNLGLTEQSLTLLQKIGQSAVQCQPPQPSKTELQVSQQLATIISSVQGIPQTIVSSLQVPNAQNSQLIPYLAKLQEWAERISSQIAGLGTIIASNTGDMKQFFLESQKSLVAVKKIVTQTTEVVQSSAAAATAALVSASRSLCNAGKKDDLS